MAKLETAQDIDRMRCELAEKAARAFEVTKTATLASLGTGEISKRQVADKCRRKLERLEDEYWQHRTAAGHRLGTQQVWDELGPPRSFRALLTQLFPPVAAEAT